MWIIVLNNKVRILEILYFLDIIPCPTKLGEWSRFALKLDLECFYMVTVYMGIAELDNELSGGRVGNMRNHVSEEGVGGDVEGNAQSEISRPLIHQTRQFGFAGRVRLGR
jgi:hypothetical protein